MKIRPMSNKARPITRTPISSACTPQPVEPAFQPRPFVLQAKEAEPSAEKATWSGQASVSAAPPAEDLGYNFGAVSVHRSAPPSEKNKTGLPDKLKAGIESLSGISMADVAVHYNSSKPAQVQALAYTQGSHIFVAPRQERNLPHEAWHVVQQKQGRVQPTLQAKGIAINDDQELEREADTMGGRAKQVSSGSWPGKGNSNADNKQVKSPTTQDLTIHQPETTPPQPVPVQVNETSGMPIQRLIEFKHPKTGKLIEAPHQIPELGQYFSRTVKLLEEYNQAELDGSDNENLLKMLTYARNILVQSKSITNQSNKVYLLEQIDKERQRLDPLIAKFRKFRKQPDMPTLVEANLKNISKKREKFGERLNMLSDEEAIAILGYTTQDYKMLNPILRGAEQAQPPGVRDQAKALTAKKIEPYIKMTSAALEKLSPFQKKITLYRGTTLPSNVLESVLQRRLISDRAFQSTTAKLETARGMSGTRHKHLIKILAHSTGRDISVLTVHPEETEILFPPDTTWIVDKISKNEDRFDYIFEVHEQSYSEKIA